MNIRDFKEVAILCLALWSVQITPAYAYMDPGTGSLLLQGLLGGIAGAAVFIRLYWYRLRSWLGWTKSGESNSESD